MNWRMEFNRKKIISYECGKYFIDCEAFKAEHFRNVYKKTFQKDLPHRVEVIFDKALQQVHGTVVVILEKDKIENEVKRLLEESVGIGLANWKVGERFPDMKEWYDGYHFGNMDVYCPWDVVSQCDILRGSKDAAMEPHWVNSSSNVILRDILKNATEAVKAEIEMLISGEIIEKEIMPELTYTDLESQEVKIRQTYLWSVLYAAGYLTDAGKPNGRIHRLTIPNKEVLGIYEEKIRSWFKVLEVQ